MFKVYKKEIEVAGKKISLETGKVARQADGAIIASCGETVILATVVGAKKVNPDMDYFPLSVNYQEKYYAGGKIPGGYFKREARPTESETLISRLIGLQAGHKFQWGCPPVAQCLFPSPRRGQPMSWPQSGHG